MKYGLSRTENEAKHSDFVCFSTWQLRKILVSKDMLYVARKSENVPIDTIPLHEILAVTGMSDEHRRDSSMANHVPSMAHLNTKKVGSKLDPSGLNSAAESNRQQQMLAEDFRCDRLINNDVQFVREHYDKVFQIKTDQDGFNSGPSKM